MFSKKRNKKALASCTSSEVVLKKNLYKKTLRKKTTKKQAGKQASRNHVDCQMICTIEALGQSINHLVVPQEMKTICDPGSEDGMTNHHRGSCN